MKLDKIGAILKGRIKDCGYTQEEFAEQTGIAYSTLKKYISGKNCCDIETLEKFADVLHCSYDFLLGKTNTPEAQYRSVKDATKLADGSIARLLRAVDEEDAMLIATIDYLIQNDKLIGSAQDYISILLHDIEHEDEDELERYIMLNDHGIIENSMRLGNYRLRAPELTDVYLAGIMTAFKDNLDKFGEDIPIKIYSFKGQKDKKRKNADI